MITKKEIRILSITLVGILLGIIDGRVLEELNIPIIVINITIFLIILISTFLISYFLNDHSRNRGRLISILFNFILIYTIYWFVFVTALVSRIPQ